MRVKYNWISPNYSKCAFKSALTCHSTAQLYVLYLLHLNFDMGGGIKFYLALFNAVSTLGWTAVLALTIKHLYDGNVTVPVQESPVTYFKSAFNSQFCGELLSKARTTYFDIGSIVQFVQSIAILEVVHVIIGFVRSPLPTTAMQVASRLYIVYYIAPLFVQVS